MTNNSTIATPPKVSTWTGVNLLLITIYGGLAVLLVVIFTQRAILRLKLKFSSSHTSIGKNIPKKLKQEIYQRLEKTQQVIVEPILLKENDPRLRNENQDPSLENYVYRMKAVDDVKKIDKALDENLCRPPLKSLKQHLLDVKSHSSGVMRAVRTNKIIALADAYTHARYGTEKFGEEEYRKYLELLNEILESIGQKTRKKKSKRVKSVKDDPNKTSDKLPLLKEKDE